MAQIIGIDPGNTHSAIVILDGDGVPVHAAKLPNDEMWHSMRVLIDDLVGPAPMVVIEQVRSYGMPVGAEVFDTVRWAGRFEQVATDCECEIVLLPRLDVKAHLCHASNAKDSHIRQALVDRFGGKDAAIGVKARPGPLYGFKSDLWAALAVAVVQFDRVHPTEPVARRRATPGTVQFVTTPLVDDASLFPAINF